MPLFQSLRRHAKKGHTMTQVLQKKTVAVTLLLTSIAMLWILILKQVEGTSIFAETSQFLLSGEIPEHVTLPDFYGYTFMSICLWILSFGVKVLTVLQ